MTAHRFQSLGWALFSVSALFFIVAAARAGDVIALVGAVAFMAANAAFIVAHRRTAPATADLERRDQ